MFVKITAGPDVGCIREMDDKAGQNLIDQKHAVSSTEAAYLAWMETDLYVPASKALQSAPENKALGATPENKGDVATAVATRKRARK